MKVVYHCYGGSHASPVAAAIHLHLLPGARQANRGDLLKLDLFDQVPRVAHGTLIFVGQDQDGHEIFVLGTRNSSDILLKVLKGVTRIIGENYHDYLFVDVKPCINLPMRIGGFLSRSVGLVVLGRPIVTWGVLKAYPKISALVAKTRFRLAGAGEGKSR